MRKCFYQYINDCNNFQDDGPRPCCLECEEHDNCVERCPRSETTFCVSMIEERDYDCDC